jgi:hypothetical protein
MTASTAPHDEPYRELVDYTWTEKAFDMLERDDLHGEAVSRDGIVGSRVWGPCPRCGHELDDRQTHTAVTNLMFREWRTARGGSTGQPVGVDIGQVFFAVDVSCGCGDSHPDAPSGTTGCGVSFRVELPLQVVGSSKR